MKKITIDELIKYGLESGDSRVQHLVLYIASNEHITESLDDIQDFAKNTSSPSLKRLAEHVIDYITTRDESFEQFREKRQSNAITSWPLTNWLLRVYRLGDAYFTYSYNNRNFKLNGNLFAFMTDICAVILLYKLIIYLFNL